MLRGFQRISGALRYEAALVVRIAIRFGSSSVCASTSKYQIELVFISPFLVADDRGLYCYTSKYIGDWVLNTAQLVYQLQHQHLIVERLDNTFWLGHLGSCGRLNFKLVMVAGKLRFGPRLLKHALEDVHGSTLAVTAVACAEFHLFELPQDLSSLWTRGESTCWLSP